MQAVYSCEQLVYTQTLHKLYYKYYFRLILSDYPCMYYVMYMNYPCMYQQVSSGTGSTPSVPPQKLTHSLLHYKPSITQEFLNKIIHSLADNQCHSRENR